MGNHCYNILKFQGVFSECLLVITKVFSILNLLNEEENICCLKQVFWFKKKMLKTYLVFINFIVNLVYLSISIKLFRV